MAATAVIRPATIGVPVATIAVPVTMIGTATPIRAIGPVISASATLVSAAHFVGLGSGREANDTGGESEQGETDRDFAEHDLLPLVRSGQRPIPCRPSMQTPSQKCCVENHETFRDANMPVGREFIFSERNDNSLRTWPTFDRVIS
jgi:hypothetical protein